MYWPSSAFGGILKQCPRSNLDGRCSRVLVVALLRFGEGALGGVSCKGGDCDSYNLDKVDRLNSPLAKARCMEMTCKSSPMYDRPTFSMSQSCRSNAREDEEHDLPTSIAMSNDSSAWPAVVQPVTVHDCLRRGCVDAWHRQPNPCVITIAVGGVCQGLLQRANRRHSQATPFWAPGQSQVRKLPKLP